MSEIAVRVESLSKKYRIGGQQERYKTLRDSLADIATAPLSRLMHFLRRQPVTGAGETIWALDGLSFEVKRGEVVGIIGRNGAGKSTLLKILSRITEPTQGYAEMHGRVGSLLEVGTGFHPELTGRENIYLNGAILGMRKVEIESKFDEIVAFSGVEKFIDTPVKHYSSGMYLRLAFAVAAHLEPEILLVDEVLAVGDLEFQKKCLGKMQDVGKHGRTVLFVSHNMQAVSSLCHRAILLDGGKIAADGVVEEVVSKYLRWGTNTTGEVKWQFDNAPANDVARLIRIRACDEQAVTRDSFDIRKPIGVEIEYQVVKPNIWFTPSIQVANELGVLLFNSAAQIDPDWENCYPEPGLYRSTCWIPGNFLAEGLLTVRVTLWGFSRPPHKGVVVHDAVMFHVYDNIEGDSVRGRTTGGYPGVVRPKLEWTTEMMDPPDRKTPSGLDLKSGLSVRTLF